MTTQQEKLSALMDGEYTDKDILDVLGHDVQLRQTWSRYHVVRSAMRKEMPSGQFLDVSEKIAEAIEQESLLNAEQTQQVDNVIRPVKFAKKWLPFAKQSGQFAVAASVAVAVILGVQQTNQTTTSEPFQTAPPINAQPLGGLAPVSLEQRRVIPNQQKREDMLESKRHINALINDHEQQVRLKADNQKNESDQSEQKPKP